MITRRAPQISGVAINGLSMLIALVFFAPFAAFNLPTQNPSLEAIGATAALGVFSTGLAFWIFFIVLKEIGPARASLVVYPNTAVAVILGIIILNEKLTLAIAIGLPLVLIGSYFASKKSETPVVTG
jgi:drug/metabolite transporter (DMT)-like permease